MTATALSNKKKLLNVLLIDDEKTILDLNSFLLEEYFTVFSSENLTAAQKVLELHEIHIIVSDHFIGDENGLKFLISLKKSYPSIIKILFTSCISQEVMIESHNSQEIFKYLTKPCSNKMFLENMKLAEIAWQVLQFEIQMKNEHQEMKDLIGETDSKTYQIQQIKNAFSNLIDFTSKNLIYLTLATIICGLVTLTILYIIKSLLGFDIFK